MALPSFSDVEQHALRLTGWRVNPQTADRAWKGEIVATVTASGCWAVTEKGETVAVGVSDSAVVSALAALTVAEAQRQQHRLARLGQTR